MGKPKVKLVEPQTFTVNLPTVGAPMTIRAEGDEVVVLMRLTLRPRDNVMNIDFDVSTNGDGTAMPGLNEDAAADISRYWRTTVPT